MESKMKEKSIEDILKQITRIQMMHHAEHLETAYKIAQYYINQIEETQKIWGEKRTLSDGKLLHKKYSHRIRSFVPDTSLEVIRSLEPYELQGLYFIDSYGEKRTPGSLWFGCDTRIWRDDDECYNGRCYCPYDCALNPVMLPNGERYVRRDLANVSAYYKNGMVYGFYHE